MIQMKKIVLLAILLLTVVLPSIAQTLRGRVVDSRTQDPIIGAVLSVKGASSSQLGSVTDADGRFKLSVKKTPAVVVVSYAGYKKEEIDIFEITDDELPISLTEDFNALQGVVVVGYGTQKKSDLTGSLTELKADDFNKGIATSVDQLLQGTAPGLNIQQASSEPGGSVNVRIRGNSSINAGSSPLYVIDGVPIDNSTLSSSSRSANLILNAAKNPLNSLNPSDIESIEVLKDASATAIYGSRAANGVILIQTKHGNKGKTKVDYAFEYGIQSAAKKIDLLSGQEYVRVMNDLAIARGEKAPFSTEDAIRIGSGTDWQELVLRTAAVQSHNVSVSGGNESLNYYLSGNYLKQDGIVRNTGTEKFGVRINLSGDLSKHSKIGFNLNTSRINDSNFSDGNGLNEAAGPINTALLYDPSESVYDENGNITQSDFLTINNPEAVIQGTTNKTISTRSLGNFFYELKPISNVKVRLNLGADLQNVRQDVYNSQLTINGASHNGQANISAIEKSDYVAELTANYSKEIFRNASLEALAGTTYQYFLSRTVSAGIGDFPSDDLLTNNLGLGNTSTASLGSNKQDHALLSYLGRINLSYDNRYLFTASLRADGSSRFGKNNRFGYFPSFALGWNLNNEKFIPDFFDNLKLRLSYGTTGNQEIGNYQSVRNYSSGGTFVSGNSYTIGIAPSRIANPDLKWETTAQFNAGIDIAIFKGRLSTTFDYFVKNTTDMLINVPLPTGTGYSSIYQNIGSMRNSGVELQVNSVIFNQKHFKWTSSLSIATLRNKVTDLGSVTKILTGSIANGGNTTVIEEGSPAFSYYGYNVIGIFQTEEEVASSSQPDSRPGYPIFEDVNQNGQIDAGDQKIIGDPYPDFTYGFHNTLTWNKLSLSFLIQGQIGGEILNGNIIETMYPSNNRRNMMSEIALNRWTTNNTDTKWPSGVNPRSYGSGYVNTLALESASYLRLKYIQISYQLPIHQNGIIKSATVHVNAQNLFTISKYMGYDPEANTFGNSSAHVDLNSYPLVRTFSVGANLSF